MIQLYYNEKDDAVLMVENGILKYYDKGINSIEFLSYFEVGEVEELKNITKEKVLYAYDCLEADCRFNCGIGAWEEYLKYVLTKKIEGELLIAFE